MKEILFGAAYYAEYMPYNRIKEDLKMMRDAGMNVIRIAESTWSVMEPKEGVFDFSYIDAVLDEAEATGMYVIIGTPTYAVPSWLVRKEPDIMVTSKEGQAIYGHRQIMNILNPVYRERSEIMIRALLTHTAKRACVIGFQIDNETKHYGNFGKQIQELFREYMKEKFVTTEAFNKAFYLNYWSNSIADWEDFPDMRGCCNGGLASEFAEFQRKTAAEFLFWQADLVKEYKREEQFITHNLDFEWKKFGAQIAQDGYSYGIQPDINHYEVAKCLTLAGTDIYHPTKDCLTGAEIAFGGDAIRTLKDQSYLVLECQAQAFKYWTPYPGQLRLHAYSHLASGACGAMYWNWHSIHNGYETYWKGVLSHDLQPNPVYEEAAVIGHEWKERQEKFLLKKKKNQVALLVDAHSLDAMKWYPVDKALSYNDIVRWMYDSLYEINLECDIVDARMALEQGFDKYKMVVAPGLYSAKEELLKQLDAFVAKGGMLVAGFRSFVADEYLSVYPDIQPHLLHKCLGMHYHQFTEPGTAKLLHREVKYHAELLVTDTAKTIAMYEHKYWGEYAGITRNEYGSGVAYYIGCYTEKATLKELFQKAAEDVEIEFPGEKEVYQWPVIIRSGENPCGHKIHYILHYADQEKEILCPYENAIDLLTGKIYEKGTPLVLKEWDVKILEES